jgi:hypothetical protein
VAVAVASGRRRTRCSRAGSWHVGALSPARLSTTGEPDAASARVSSRCRPPGGRVGGWVGGRWCGRTQEGTHPGAEPTSQPPADGAASVLLPCARAVSSVSARQHPLADFNFMQCTHAIEY